MPQPPPIHHHFNGWYSNHQKWVVHDIAIPTLHRMLKSWHRKSLLNDQRWWQITTISNLPHIGHHWKPLLRLPKPGNPLDHDQRCHASSQYTVHLRTGRSSPAENHWDLHTALYGAEAAPWHWIWGPLGRIGAWWFPFRGKSSQARESHHWKYWKCLCNPENAKASRSLPEKATVENKDCTLLILYLGYLDDTCAFWLDIHVRPVTLKTKGHYGKACSCSRT